MLDKLEKLGATRSSISKKALKNDLAKLEEHTGKLPLPYKKFLLHFGGSILFNVNVFFKSISPSPWADEDGYDVLESLYGLNGLGKDYTVFEALETYKNTIGKDWLPIGSSSGGNQVCMCLNMKSAGQIWYWDHETEITFNKSEVASGLSLIANSFEGFIKILEFKEDNIDTTGIISVELDF